MSPRRKTSRICHLTENPTIDRYDETVERVAEDFYSRAMPRTGPRRVIARFHTPLNVRDYLDADGSSLRTAVAPLTKAMESAVQSGIDAINAGNDAPGASLVHEARQSLLYHQKGTPFTHPAVDQGLR
jgi:hypothetical protein